MAQCTCTSRSTLTRSLPMITAVMVRGEAAAAAAMGDQVAQGVGRAVKEEEEAVAAVEWAIGAGTDSIGRTSVVEEEEAMTFSTDVP